MNANDLAGAAPAIRNSTCTPARSYTPGIGDGVADRTYNRKLDPQTRKQLPAWDKAEGPDLRPFVRPFVRETWEEVARRTSMGNALLCPDRENDMWPEFHALHHHMRQASVIMSGRHLQHGDPDQPLRNMEVFTNCSTSVATYLTFYLLLNGSGVGRSYDDDLMVVDWSQMPVVCPVIDRSHPDVQSGEIEAVMDRATALHFYAGRDTVVFEVPDSREGWAKAVEKMETMAYLRKRNTVLILDFSKVRCRNSPIKGMQNRPASGPGPLMASIFNLARLRDSGMAPWRAAMYADHYASECVLVGGARRAARMSTKTWRDSTVLEFITVKRPAIPGGDVLLWSSNNSVCVDEEFWKLVLATESDLESESIKTRELASHAKAVFEAVVRTAYFDRTGEPGFINQHKLNQNNEGTRKLLASDFLGFEKYQPTDEGMELVAVIARRVSKKRYQMITNPCGEITLAMWGGYCLIGDIVPFHAAMALRAVPRETLYKEESELMQAWDDDAVDAARTCARALIRTNLMQSLYHGEVARTNRIGVGITGIFEYAWARFGFAWKELIDEQVSLPFWLQLSRMKRAVQEESANYSKKLGVVVPHTDTTMKPSGTVSKLFSLTEAAHLPAMAEYLRWVQYRDDDPLVEQLRNQGYPVLKLDTYKGHTIVGFPTRPTICELGLGDRLVTAGEATPEEQYQWLRLLEKYWIVGVDEDGTPLRDTGNQVSYTLKYKPELVSYEQFRATILKNQPTVRCCSVMPQEDLSESAHEYLPEEAVTKERFELIAAAIKTRMAEGIDGETMQCEGGACPIEFGQVVGG